MKRTYNLFTISPTYRALIFILMSIGIFWPLMMIHYITGYQQQPPLDLAVPFLMALSGSVLSIRLSQRTIRLTIFGCSIYKFSAQFITTRQEGKLNRVMFREFKADSLKPTLFLFNLVPVELMEYINE